MTAYIVEGEVLNTVFGPFSAPIDKAEYLRKPILSYVANQYGPPLKIPYSIYKHSMYAVIRRLKNEQ